MWLNQAQEAESRGLSGSSGGLGNVIHSQYQASQGYIAKLGREGGGMKEGKETVLG